jgi:hypothetical protein
MLIAEKKPTPRTFSPSGMMHPFGMAILALLMMMLFSMGNGMMTDGGGPNPQALTAIYPVPINLAQTTRNAVGLPVPAPGSGNPHVADSTDTDASSAKPEGKLTLVMVVGPISAGKSSVADVIAEKLDCEHFDSDTIDGIPAHYLGKDRIRLQLYAIISKLMKAGILVVSSNGSPFCDLFTVNGVLKTNYNFERTLFNFGIDSKRVNVVVVRVGDDLSDMKSRMINRITRNPDAWGLKLSKATASNKKKSAEAIGKLADDYVKNCAWKLYSPEFDYDGPVFRIPTLPDAVPDPDQVLKLVTESGLLAIEFVRDADESFTDKPMWTGMYVIDQGLKGKHITAAYGTEAVDLELIKAFSCRSVNCFKIKLSGLLGLSNMIELEIAIPVDCQGFTRVHITLKDNKGEFPAKLFGDLAETIRKALGDQMEYIGLSSADMKTWLYSKKAMTIDARSVDGTKFQMEVKSCILTKYTMSGKAVY